MAVYCWACATYSDELPVTRRSLCPGCKRPLRSCKNCTSYDIHRLQQCILPDIEPVHDKERENFCDYYKPNTKKPSPKPANNETKKAFKQLFK